MRTMLLVALLVGCGGATVPTERQEAEAQISKRQEALLAREVAVRRETERQYRAALEAYLDQKTAALR